MTGGFAVTKEPGTDRFAQRFRRRRVRCPGLRPPSYREQPRVAAASPAYRRAGRRLAGHVAGARDLPGVDPSRIAIWSFSACGPEVLQVAAANPELAAAIAQTPNTEHHRRRPRTQHPTGGRYAMARFTGRGIAEARRHAGWPAATTGAADRRAGSRRAAHRARCPGRRPGADPVGQYFGWRQEIATRSALRVGSTGPDGTRAGCAAAAGPGCDQDQSALAAPAVRAAGRARTANWSGCPAGTTRRSSTAMRQPWRPSCLPAPALLGQPDAVPAELARQCRWGP